MSVSSAIASTQAPSSWRNNCHPSRALSTSVCLPTDKQRRRAHVRVAAEAQPQEQSSVQHGQGRREVFAVGALSLVGSSWGFGLIRPQVSHALTPPGFKKDMSKFRRRTAVPEEDFLDLSNGIKYYDLTVGKGPEPEVGDRIAVHFDVKLRNLTVATSRQGAGVTGGTPYGFQVGLNPGDAGAAFIKGMDYGVQGMKVGGFRRLIIPPKYAYQNRSVQEIPPNATLTLDLELLSIKTSPLLGMNPSMAK